MAIDMDYQWLLFCPQLPANPSSPRVMVWRRMHSIGSLGLDNGLWVLPDSPQAEKFMKEMQVYVESQGGSSKIFIANALDDITQKSILEGFHKERSEEYGELQEQCNDFLIELEKETKRRNFSYAEYEENEQDLNKLENWFSQIQKREFNMAEMSAESAPKLGKCRQALQNFAIAVFDQAGKNEAGQLKYTADTLNMKILKNNKENS